MFRFENPDYFYLAWGILILIVLQYVTDKQHQKRKLTFGQPELLSFLQKNNNSNNGLQQKVLFFLGLIFLMFALANPQWGNKKEEIEVKRADIYIAMDISNSMNAADIIPSRLEKAKKFTSDLINHFKGNRIGVIFFAGNAYLQMPLTVDYASALMYIKTIHTAMAPTQGSSIAEAISLSHKFDDEKDISQKALVIISDGDDHDGDAVAEAKSFAKKGNVIFTVGVGTEKGSTIPIISDEGEDLAREDDGQPAISKLNFSKLKDIASAGKGNAFILGNEKQIFSKIQTKLELLQKQHAEIHSFSDYNSYYFIFVLLALICFSGMLFELKFTGKWSFIFILLVFSVNSSYTQSAHSLLKNGDKLYGMNRFMQAEKQYEEAGKKEPGFQSFYNRGNALYQQNNFSKAEQVYSDAVTKSGNPEDLYKAYHNLGNTYYNQQKYKESVDAYKNALKYNSKDKETIENLLKARKKMEEQKRQQNQNKNNKDKSKENNSPQDKQNQDQNNTPEEKKEEQKSKNKDKSRENLSKEEAEKLMEIIENEDKKVNKKIRRGSGEQKTLQKPW
jgi:tetratricopeptide (TPR) repeat protein